MSFLGKNHSELLSARITQKGRNSIAKGNFVIKFFQIGDSEFDYTTPFNGLTGTSGVPSQAVFAPLDKEGGVKYPYLLDTSEETTTYGHPILHNSTETLRNVIGAAGFVSNYMEYDSIDNSGTRIVCPTQRIDVSTLSGTNTITVQNGKDFNDCEFITVTLDQFAGGDTEHPIITGSSKSYVYSVRGVNGNTITVDRNTPNFTSIPPNTRYAQVISNDCEVEYPIESEIHPACSPTPVNPEDQQNPWTLNVVWGEKPVGFDVNGLDENIANLISNGHASTKQFLGYTTSEGQKFTNKIGVELEHPSAYKNSFGDIIDVKPEEQRCVAIIHFSEMGDIINDPERFFKYDDYISTNNDAEKSLAEDEYGAPLTDQEYFEVFIPFIQYHRATQTTAGARFFMGGQDNYVVSKVNEGHRLVFRYLVDESGNNVGKIFFNNKTIVFDDQELVAILEYKANRRYTLPAPKVALTPSDSAVANALIGGETTQNVWVTYFFNNTKDKATNGLPCNYFTKIEVTTEHSCHNQPSQVNIKFADGSFNHLDCTTPNGIVSNEFHILIQITGENELPRHDAWKKVNVTGKIAGHTVGEDINLNNIEGKSFIITKLDYNNAPLYDVEEYLSEVPNEPSALPQFGDKQPFPGSVRLVRATDVEQLGYLINLPATQFVSSQNPTYESGKDKYVTEVALLNSEKEVMVVAKASEPIKRLGTQVFKVKLDF